MNIKLKMETARNLLAEINGSIECDELVTPGPGLTEILGRMAQTTHDLDLLILRVSGEITSDQFERESSPQ